MHHFRTPALAILLLSVSVAPAWAQDEKVTFVQYVPLGGSCEYPQEGSDRAKSIAGTEILFAWLGKLIVDALDRAAQKAIKEHTHSYGNKPGYVLLDDPKPRGSASLWAMDDNSGKMSSCFRFWRTEGTSTDSSLDLTGRLWKDEQGIRVGAESVRWNRMSARHSGGKAALSISFTMHSLRNTPDGGSRWISPEALIVSLEQAVPKLKPGGATNIDGEMIEERLTYKDAVLLPLPPKLSGDDGDSLVAFQVTAVEAGRPSFGLRAYARFLADNKDDLSEAAADALGKIR